MDYKIKQHQEKGSVKHVYFRIGADLHGMHECFVDNHRYALRCYKFNLDHGPKIYFEYGK